MGFDEAFTHLILESMRTNPETSAMIRKSRDGRERLVTSVDLRRGLAVCDTEVKVLLYCHKYMYAHYDAFLHVLRFYDDIVQERLFNLNARPTFIDFGCGPMTSGLALADHYSETRGSLMSLTYIGIDNCEMMLAKAQEFAEYPGMFNEDSRFDFVASWNDIDQERLRAILPNDTPLVLNFSYFFGQEISDSTLNDLADFVSRVRTAFKANRPLIAFLNASYPQANVRYRRFKNKLCQSGVGSEQ